MMNRAVLMTAAVVCAAAGVNAQSLKVGDKAPPITVDQWVKGAPVTKLESGKPYVVEFWATWCGPCVKAIPHLSELQTQHDDVTIIGVAGFESKGVDHLKSFVKERSDQIAYRIAFDEDKSMSEAWMTAAGKNTIPTAFLVDGEGKIAWIGSPSGLDKEIAKVSKTKSRAGEQKKDEKDTSEKLAIGDKAPEITVSKWVKGEPVTGFEKGRVYVMEFWATWCGPCIAGIPHLTELQQEYKDKGVRIVGVSIWESDQAKVEPFVKTKGDEMGYTVAMDDVPAGAKGSEGKMAQAWMAAAGRNGIPSAFIVNQEGRIAWMGHPMQMDKPLEEIVNGTWDLEKARDQHRKEAEQARKQREQLMKNQPIQVKFTNALRASKWEAAFSAADELLNTGDQQTAAMWFNALSWTLVDPDTDEDNDPAHYDLALRAAEKANTLTESKSPAILDTLARAHWVKGNKAEALEFQRKAVRLATPDMKEDLEDRLAEYQKEVGGG